MNIQISQLNACSRQQGCDDFLIISRAVQKMIVKLNLKRLNNCFKSLNCETEGLFFLYNERVREMGYSLFLL